MRCYRAVCSAGLARVPQTGQQPRPREEPYRPLLLGVNDDGVGGVMVDEIVDDTVPARRRLRSSAQSSQLIVNVVPRIGVPFALGGSSRAPNSSG